jgi:protein-disulfide isomerase
MKQLILWGLITVAAAACHSDKRDARTAEDAEAERRQAERFREDLRNLELAMIRELEKEREATREIERKLDELNRKMDALAARGAAGAAPPRPPRPEPDRSKVYAVPIDGDPFDGPADAKVTLVKAYDYACGYCEKVRPTMEDLKKKYGKDLRIVYKQLVIHPKNAMIGALAFCAAAKQGKHREMDALIWDKGFNARQLDLTDVPVGQDPDAQRVKCWDHPDGCKNVYGYAAELGLNMAKFKADLKGDCTSVVANDGRQLAQLGISATPSFFINGRYMSGAQPIEQFSALIDEELQKAKERVAAGTRPAAYYQKWVMEQGLKSLQP